MNVRQLIRALEKEDPDMLVTSVFNGVEEEIVDVQMLDRGDGHALYWYNSNNEEQVAPRVRLD